MRRIMAFRQYEQLREAAQFDSDKTIEYSPAPSTGNSTTGEYTPSTSLPPGGPPRQGTHGSIGDSESIRRILALIVKIDPWRDYRTSKSGNAEMGISGTVDFMSPEMAGRHAMPGGVAEEDEIDNMQAFLVHGSQIFPELSNEARQVMRAWLEFRNLFLPNVGSHHQEGQEQHNYLYYKVTLKHYNQMVPLLKQLEQEIMQPNSDHNPAISTRWTAFMTACEAGTQAGTKAQPGNDRSSKSLPGRAYTNDARRGIIPPTTGNREHP